MPDEMLNTKEVSEYLDIHEKQVYALIKAGKIPCTRVTGKWIFPKQLIDEWIRSNARNSISIARQKSKNFTGSLLAAGSNDPVLDMLLNYTKAVHPEFHVFTSSIGSTAGLNLLLDDLTDIAWCHLYDPETGNYNIPFISENFKERDIAVVHLFYRELGFVTLRDLQTEVQSFGDIRDNKLRFINRQKGAGTRILIDFRLKEQGVSSNDIEGYEDEVFTHLEVGLAVSSGKAHTGIASVAVAQLLGLKFYPLVKESFDMVMTQKVFFDQGVQAFISSLKSEDFRERVAPLGNYDFTESGKIIYSNR